MALYSLPMMNFNNFNQIERDVALGQILVSVILIVFLPLACLAQDTQKKQRLEL